MSESQSEAAEVTNRSMRVASDPATTWSWIDRNIWTDRMLAALDNGVQGGKWFSLIDKVYRPATLQAAWQQVLRNKGAAGIDRVSVERFAAHEERYLRELAQELEQGTYVPSPVRRVDIPKGDGSTRPLGIPTVKDRVVQAAVKRVIEPIFEREFLPTSYGFRPKRSSKAALKRVFQLLKDGYYHVVDADLKGYFDSIPHTQLQARVGSYIRDGRLLGLIDAWIKQDIVHELKRWTPIAGTPQGAVISPLLANLYLHDLDVHMAEQGYAMVRYADDFVILCRTADDASNALDCIQRWTQANGLELHQEKTHIGDCRQAGQGFHFLGYRFEAGNRWVRSKSLHALKAKIRANTRRTCGRSLQQVIAIINPILRGWFGYFKHAHRWTFPTLDALVRRRLRAILRKQSKRPGFGRTHADHKRWPNAFFAAAGLFTMTEAWHAASQSR